MNENLKQVMETVESFSDSTIKMALIKRITGEITLLESAMELAAIENGAGAPQSAIAGYRSVVFDAPWIVRTLCVDCGRSKFILGMINDDGTSDSAYPFTRQGNWACQYGEQCDFCDAPISMMEPESMPEESEESDERDDVRVTDSLIQYEDGWR